MGWLLALIIGGLLGWLMSYTVRQERRGVSVPVGIIMGALGGIAGPAFFGNLLGITGRLNASLGNITFPGFLWSLIGAIIVAGIALGAVSLPFIGRHETGRTYAEEIRKRDDNKREK